MFQAVAKVKPQEYMSAFDLLKECQAQQRQKICWVCSAIEKRLRTLDKQERMVTKQKLFDIVHFQDLIRVD